MIVAERVNIETSVMLTRVVTLVRWCVGPRFASRIAPVTILLRKMFGFNITPEAIVRPINIL